MRAARRGRPPRSAYAPTDGDKLGQLRSRVAWLLRVNRLYGRHDAWVNAAEFATAFAGGCYPDQVSESKVSRWETGFTAVPRAAVLRYEQLLGLPVTSLTSTVDVVTRYMSPQLLPRGGGLVEASGSATDPERHLESFFEQVGSSDVMTAADWADMTSLFASTPGLRLRRKEWEGICDRLLVETIAADGGAWMPRFEAFNRLLRHPDGQQSAVAACAAWVGCRENRVFTETVGLLDACSHPDAASAVIRQLTAPTNDDAFTGALMACIRKVAEGHFSPSQLKVIAAVTAEVLSGSRDKSDQTHLDAVTVQGLLRRIPNPGIQCHMRDLKASSADGSAPSSPARASPLGGLIAVRSTSLLPRQISHFDDRVLPGLIRELIYAHAADTRLYAAFLIRATPYWQPVADSLVWGLGRLHHAHDPSLTPRFLQALRVLGQAAQRRAVESLALDPRLPFSIQEAAFQALGHMGGRSTTGFWQRALALHTTSAQAGRNNSERLLNHAVYSLIIRRDIAELRTISEHALAPSSVQTSARWWLSLPAHLLDSAER